MRPVVHLAAAPVGQTQACARCGELLQDYRNAMVCEGSGGPHWWGFGAHVEVTAGNPRMYALTLAAPNCERPTTSH